MIHSSHFMLIFLLGSAPAAAEAPTGAAPGAERPNVVVILADDLGYGELSCYPHDLPVKTPNIDRLSREGIRMTHGYSAHPMCWPSRASVLTGRYYQRFLRGRVIPDSEKLIGDYLREAGYATACVGKWHNVARPGDWNRELDAGNHPLHRGFDRFYGFLGGMRDYFDPAKGFQTGRGWISMPIYDQKEPVEEIDYLTFELTDQAVAFIEQRRSEPFFLYLAYTAVHTPNQAPEEYVRRRDGDVHLAMIDALDEGVGRVLDALESAGVADNTLVFFIGDNGGFARGANWKLRSRKGRWYEGGIRVPFLVRWPAALPKGKVYVEPVMHIDVLPTIPGALGPKSPRHEAVDGVNLLPYLRGERDGSPHEMLFWGDTRGRYFAVRRGTWKLVRASDQPGGDPELGLYDLKTDVTESRNLLDERPAIARELRQAYIDWAKGIEESREKQAREVAKGKK